jgi:hypothetical protein
LFENTDTVNGYEYRKAGHSRSVDETLQVIRSAFDCSSSTPPICVSPCDTIGCRNLFATGAIRSKNFLGFCQSGRMASRRCCPSLKNRRNTVIPPLRMKQHGLVNIYSNTVLISAGMPCVHEIHSKYGQEQDHCGPSDPFPFFIRDPLLPHHVARFGTDLRDKEPLR